MRFAHMALAMMGLGAVALATPTSARANGAFPSAGQILVSPTDPNHLWVRTDFGIAVSHDAGVSWTILCKESAGYNNTQTPALAVTPSGKLVLALSTGVAVGALDECSFTHIDELEGQAVGDVSQNPDGTTIVFAAPSFGPIQVYESTDDAVTFAPVTGALPVKFQPLTLDSAPSDSSRIYLSGLDGNPAAPDGAFLRSFDGGASFEEITIPGIDLESAPFIAAVDPQDPDRVYVRLNGAPGKLLVTDDAGDHFTEIFTGVGFLRAFALSPDGSKAYVGGEADGLQRATVPTYDFQPISNTAARCLKTTAGQKLFACGSDIQQGYSAAVSTDDGASFTPLLQLKCITGVYGCPAGTPQGDLCPPQWPLLMQELQTADCSMGGAGPSVTSTNASATSTHAAATASNAAASGTGGSGGGGSKPSSGGCGSCAVGANDDGLSLFCLVGCAIAGAAAVGRRVRRG